MALFRQCDNPMPNIASLEMNVVLSHQWEIMIDLTKTMLMAKPLLVLLNIIFYLIIHLSMNLIDNFETITCRRSFVW